MEEEVRIRIIAEAVADAAIKKLEELAGTEKDLTSATDQARNAAKGASSEYDKQAGLVAQLEKKISDLRIAMRASLNRDDIQKYTVEIEKAEKELAELTGTAEKGTSIFKTLGTMILGFVAADKIMDMAKSTFELVNQTDRLQTALKNALSSNEEYTRSLQFLDKLSNDYGQNLNILTKSYTNFIASSNSSNLSLEERQRIYASIVKAGSALKLSNDEIEGSLTAISQMFSKGNVQAEELRGQLGERLPGAFDMAAKAMGVTTMQLNKMLEDGEVLAVDLLPKLATELENTYGAKAQSNLQTVGGAWNRVINSIIKYTAEVNEATGFTKILAGGINALADNFGTVISVAGTAVKGFVAYRLVLLASEVATKGLLATTSAWLAATKAGLIIKGQAILALEAYTGMTIATTQSQIAATTAARSFNAALASTGPLLAFSAALYGLYEIFVSVKKSMDDANAVNLEYIKANDESIKSEQSKVIQLKIAIDHIKTLKEGTEARTYAVQQAINKFPEYLKGLNAEIASNAQLEFVYKGVNAQMHERINLMARERQARAIEDQMTNIAQKLNEKGISARTVSDYMVEIKTDNVSSAYTVEVMKYEKLAKQFTEVDNARHSIFIKNAEKELEALKGRYNMGEITLGQYMKEYNAAVKSTGAQKKLYSDLEIQQNSLMDAVKKASTEEINSINSRKAKVKELTELRDASSNTSEITKYNNQIKEQEKLIDQLSGKAEKGAAARVKAQETIDNAWKKSHQNYLEIVMARENSERKELEYLEQNNKEKAEAEREIKDALLSIENEYIERQSQMLYLRKIQEANSLEEIERINEDFAKEKRQILKDQLNQELQTHKSSITQITAEIKKGNDKEAKLKEELQELRAQYDKKHDQQMALAKTKTNKAQFDTLEAEKKTILKSISYKEDELKTTRSLQSENMKSLVKHQKELEKIEKEISKVQSEEDKERLEKKKKLLKDRQELELKMAKDGYNAQALAREKFSKDFAKLDEKELAELNAFYLKKKLTVDKYNQLDLEAKNKHGVEFHLLTKEQQDAILALVEAGANKELQDLKKHTKALKHTRKEHQEKELLSQEMWTTSFANLTKDQQDIINAIYKDRAEKRRKILEASFAVINGMAEVFLQDFIETIDEQLSQANTETERALLENQKMWAEWAKQSLSVIDAFVKGGIVNGVVAAVAWAIKGVSNLLTAAKRKYKAEFEDMKAFYEGQISTWTDFMADSQRDIEKYFGQFMDLTDPAVEYVKALSEYDPKFIIENELKRAAQINKNYETAITNAQKERDTRLAAVDSEYSKISSSEKQRHDAAIDNINKEFNARIDAINKEFAARAAKELQAYNAETLAIKESQTDQLLLLLTNEDSKTSIMAEYAEKRAKILKNTLLAETEIVDGMDQATIDAINEARELRFKYLNELQDWLNEELAWTINNEGQKRKEYTETEKIQLAAQERLNDSAQKFAMAEITRTQEKNQKIAVEEKDKNEKLEAEAVRHNDFMLALDQKYAEDKAAIDKWYNDEAIRLGLEKDEALKASFEIVKEATIRGYNEILAKAQEAFAQGMMTLEQYRAIVAEIQAMNSSLMFPPDDTLPEINPALDNSIADSRKWSEELRKRYRMWLKQENLIDSVPARVTFGQLDAKGLIGFATGTEYVDPNGLYASGTDTVPAMLTRGERVLTAEQNKALGNVSNANIVATMNAVRRIHGWDREYSMDIDPKLMQMVHQHAAMKNMGGITQADLDPLINELAEVKEILKNLPIQNFNIDQNGFSKFIKKGNSVVKYNQKRYGS